VGRVCEQAGVSRRTFYELFDDREACLLAAFDAAVERIAQSVLPAYRRKAKWHERMREALKIILEELEAEPDIARLCVIETPRAGLEVLGRRGMVLEQLATAVDEGRVEVRRGAEPPPLTAQGVVGGALSVIHARLLSTPSPTAGSRRTAASTAADAGACPLGELAGPLMAMIVHPYLGPAAARAELDRPASPASRIAQRNSADPFKGLPIRFTYRTARVLATIASDPGASNRHIADHAGIVDEGQMSRLLRRLHQCELIENRREGQPKGEANAWTLTDRGRTIHTAIAVGEDR
jgi:AcrR family transcriptional regulator